MKQEIRSFLRFPGGKSRHVDKILQYFDFNKYNEYREPFVGGGSVFLSSDCKKAWINDADVGLYNLWQDVKKRPQSLIDYIEEHTPILDHKRNPKRIKMAVDLWRKIKEDRNESFVSSGYRTLFLNKTCFSGDVNGGCIGGLEQNGKYVIAARWAARATIDRIRAAHEKMIKTNCVVSNLSWDFLMSINTSPCVIYLDPPYLHKGSKCYKHSFTLEDHKKLARVVAESKHKCVVTVDDCPELRKVWIQQVGLDRLKSEEWLYSMSDKRVKNRVGKELFIVPCV